MREDAPGHWTPSSGYRVLLLDTAGRVLRTKSLARCTEAEALDRARAFMDGRSVELWNGGRLIRRLEAPHNPTA